MWEKYFCKTNVEKNNESNILNLYRLIYKTYFLSQLMECACLRYVLKVRRNFIASLRLNSHFLLG